ncbi:MAG: RNA polymerase sigma factor [Solirubrobacteraceae bacterium]
MLRQLRSSHEAPLLAVGKESSRPLAGTADADTIAASLECPERFGELFDRHHRAVHRFLARRTLNGGADDLASLTFVVAFERRYSFRSNSSSALPWLLGIAANLLRESLREQRRELGTVIRLRCEREPGVLDTEAGTELDCERLGAALAHLEAGHREVLLLAAWEELTYEEIAVTLDLALGTVRSRLHRARRQLRVLLALPAAERSPEQPQETT